MGVAECTRAQAKMSIIDVTIIISFSVMGWRIREVQAQILVLPPLVVRPWVSHLTFSSLRLVHCMTRTVRCDLSPCDSKEMSCWEHKTSRCAWHLEVLRYFSLSTLLKKFKCFLSFGFSSLFGHRRTSIS